MTGHPLDISPLDGAPEPDGIPEALTPEIDRNGDLVREDFTPVGRDVWSEPLTESERRIIENVLVEGDLAVTRRWLRHCVQIFAAQTHP